jgi:hypothetical protein
VSSRDSRFEFKSGHPAKTGGIELVAEKIGQETTTYVRNIYKYYVAYRLTLEAEEAARKAREQVTK